MSSCNQIKPNPAFAQTFSRRLPSTFVIVARHLRRKHGLGTRYPDGPLLVVNPTFKEVLERPAPRAES